MKPLTKKMMYELSYIQNPTTTDGSKRIKKPYAINGNVLKGLEVRGLVVETEKEIFATAAGMKIDCSEAFENQENENEDYVL